MAEGGAAVGESGGGRRAGNHTHTGRETGRQAVSARNMAAAAAAAATSPSGSAHPAGSEGSATFTLTDYTHTEHRQQVYVCTHTDYTEHTQNTGRETGCRYMYIHIHSLHTRI